MLKEDSVKFECEICGEESHHWKRCEEHYCCDDCGTRDDLCFYVKDQGGLLCGACKAKLVAKQIARWNGNSAYQDCIVCPWCGYHEHDELWEYQDGLTYTCHNCERDFSLEIYTVPEFTTTKAA